MVTLWLRQDGGPPKAIERGARPRGPGAVYEVVAETADEAREVLALALAPEPPGLEPAAAIQWRATRDVARLRIMEGIGG